MAVWLLAAVLLGLAAALIAHAEGRLLPSWLALFLPEGSMEDHSTKRARFGRAGRARFDREQARSAEWDREASSSGAHRGGRRENPRLRAEVTPAWSDDAFARLFQDEDFDDAYMPRRPDPRSAVPPESDAPGQGAQRESALRPVQPPERPPRTPGDPVPGSMERTPPEPVPEQPEHEEIRRAERDEGGFRNAEPFPRRPEHDPRDPEDDVTIPFDPGMRGGSDQDLGIERVYGRDRDRIEPQLSAGGSGGRRPLSDEAWIASRFAPYGARFDAEDWRDQREARRRRTGWYYGLAAACVLLAAILIGPGLIRYVSSTASSLWASLEGPNVTVLRSRPDPLASRPPNGGQQVPAAPEPIAPTQPQALPPLPGTEAEGGAVDTSPVPPGPSMGGAASDGDIAGAPTAPGAQSSPMARFTPPLPPAAPERRPESKTSGLASVPQAGRSPGLDVEPPGSGASPRAEPDVIAATGQMVVIIQAELTKRGYDPGPVDGLAGSKTTDAIRAFRRDAGLEPNGGIDDELMQKLGIVGRRLTPFTAP